MHNTYYSNAPYPYWFRPADPLNGKLLALGGGFCWRWGGGVDVVAGRVAAEGDLVVAEGDLVVAEGDLVVAEGDLLVAEEDLVVAERAGLLPSLYRSELQPCSEKTVGLQRRSGGWPQAGQRQRERRQLQHHAGQ